jgi:putative sterol carrier protein
MATEAINPENIFAIMASRFDATAAGELSAVYQFELNGDDGGTWQVQVEGGVCSVEKGAPAQASITVLMTAADYVEMIVGQLNPQMAFMEGRLKIQGNTELALVMQKLFPKL